MNTLFNIVLFLVVMILTIALLRNVDYISDEQVAATTDCSNGYEHACEWLKENPNGL